MSEAGPPLHAPQSLGRPPAEVSADPPPSALMLLRLRPGLPETEVQLNRELYFCLLTANRELFPENEIAPVPECNNQPDPNDESRAKREHKRPDFQWIYIDRYEPDPHRSSKQFVVECKRLGNSGRADWVLNLNYVTLGIRRFHDPVWAYAQRFPSGAMVGYWQNTDAQQLLDEVNAETRNHHLPALILEGPWNLNDVSQLAHVFDRPVPISPFTLQHLWIDLRNAPDSGPSSRS